VRRAPVRSREARSPLNGVAVAFAIFCVVGSLAAAYRYYRSHQPSHDAAVQLMAFARDGESLYSLDRGGALKKWYARRALEADRWQLPEQGTATALVLSADQRFAATLVSDRLSIWRLAGGRPAQKVTQLDGVLAAVALDDARFALLERAQL